MTRDNKNKNFNNNVHYLYSTFTHKYVDEEDGLDFTISANSSEIYVGTILENENMLIKFDHKLNEKSRVPIDGEVSVVQLVKDMIFVGTSTGNVYNGPFNALQNVAKFENEITSIVPLKGSVAVAYTSGIAVLVENKMKWSLEIEAAALDAYENLLFVMDNQHNTTVSLYDLSTQVLLYKIPLLGEAKSIAVHPTRPFALFCTNSEIELHDLKSGLLHKWISEDSSYERLKWGIADTHFFFTSGHNIHLVDIAKIDSEFVDDDSDLPVEYVSSHAAFSNSVSDFAIFPIRGKQKFGVVAVDCEQIQRYAIHPELLE
eukprot:NODE_151_length_17042_cov_0.275925.p2 type:complete len:316 gc:universal NODE_151_length_17042_cov_0.275925:6779-5832(-)